MMKEYLRAAGMMVCLVFPLLNVFGGEPPVTSETDTDEEVAIISTLDSLTGRIYADRYVVPLQADVDTAVESRAPIVTISDSVMLKNILSVQSEIPLAYNDRVKRFIEVYGIEKRAKVE